MTTYWLDLDRKVKGTGTFQDPASDPTLLHGQKILKPSTGDTYYIKSNGTKPWNCGLYFGVVVNAKNVKILPWPGEASIKLNGFFDPETLSNSPVWRSSSERGDSFSNVYSIDISKCFDEYQNLTVPLNGILEAVRVGIAEDKPIFDYDPPLYNAPSNWAIEEEFSNDLNSTLYSLNSRTEAYYYFDDPTSTRS